MASKKKRNKKYSGRDAAKRGVSVTKVSVPQRSAAGKWWVENKKKVLARIVQLALILLSYLLISWLVRTIF